MLVHPQGATRAKKLKQLEAVETGTSQQPFFTRARESNENATKASYKVTKLLSTANFLPRVNLSKIL